jgi:hypothetical protein
MQQEIDRRSILLGWIPGIFHRNNLALSGVQVRVFRYAHSPRRFLVIHGDEDTARDVLTTWMYDHDGVAYVVTGKQRNVEILGLKIDPNRMFSRAGAEASIRAQNPNPDPQKVDALLAWLDRQRQKTLKHLIPPKGGRLFALHNNRDYSLQDEVASSDQTSIKQPAQPRNFFLCTDPKDFDILKQSPFNVLLQTKPDPDDGSLSRLAARRGFRYINLECAIGEYEAQLERVQWLEDHLA